MKLLGEPELVFNDYKKPGLYLATPVCNFKCVKEARSKGINFVECHNHSLSKQDFYFEISTQEIYDEFIKDNPFVECVILSGLDPMDSWENTIEFITEFREITDMEIVIFTGYYEDEIEDKLEFLKTINNITMKFGRYDPSQKSRYDEIGEITLISGNQYFKKVS